MDKKAFNPIKSKGFDSQAQVRYLLHLLGKYPEKYSWVKDALKDFGMPSEEGPLHTYWKGPYGVSPETPSYIYTGKKKKANTKQSLKKIAETAKLMKYHSPKSIANMFLAAHLEQIESSANSSQPDKELKEWVHKFEHFLNEYGHLDSFEYDLAKEYFLFKARSLVSLTKQATSDWAPSIKVEHRVHPKDLTNAYWSVWKNDIEVDRSDAEKLNDWFTKFRKFLDDRPLSTIDKIRAQNYFSDKILGRDLE